MAMQLFRLRWLLLLTPLCVLLMWLLVGARVFSLRLFEEACKGRAMPALLVLLCVVADDIGVFAVAAVDDALAVVGNNLLRSLPRSNRRSCH